MGVAVGVGTAVVPGDDEGRIKAAATLLFERMTTEQRSGLELTVQFVHFTDVYGLLGMAMSVTVSHPPYEAEQRLEVGEQLIPPGSLSTVPIPCTRLTDS